MREKKILLFTDLEGTLLRESDGQIDPESMHEFLTSLSKLQELTGYTVDIHIVSPMIPKMMFNAMQKVDGYIAKHNMVYPNKKGMLNRVRVGTASPECTEDECEEWDRRIMPMPKGVDRFDNSFGKFKYVDYIMGYYEEQGRVGIAIYAGNGQNDIEAMKRVQSSPNGYVICPANSRHTIKEFAKFVGKGDDLRGVSEGLGSIIAELQKTTGEKTSEDVVRD